FGVGYASGAGFSKATANAAFNSSTAYSFEASVPIAGWVQTGTAPALVGSVTSRSAGSIRVEAATLVSTPSTCTATPIEESGWISNGTYNATGDCTYPITTGVFSGNPICVSTASIYETRISALSNTSIQHHTADSNGTGTDTTSYLFCFGRKGTL